MKPAAPNSMQRRMTTGSSLAETMTTGMLGILRAQIHQPGKAPHARHVQVEQDEVDIVVGLERGAGLVEAAGLDDRGAGDQPDIASRKAPRNSG